MSRWKKAEWLAVLLILLAAAFLRLYQIDSVPPGMTHDEADHGMDAWGVVKGDRPLYFTVGYGREPLYDYSTAPLMLVFGPSHWAGRLAAVFWSMILIAGTYVWTKRAFGVPAAILTAAGLAVGFWPLMTARQALRSVTLPALFSLAAYWWWRGLPVAQAKRRDSANSFLLAGILLGFTLYTYLAARLTWVVFPALMAFLWLFQPDWGRGRWRWMLGGLMLAVLVAAPLLLYLQTHPAAEERLSHLSGPLEQAATGDFSKLLQNSFEGFKVLTFEGDSLWRYNLPGKPFLGPVFGALFYAGLIYALWHWRRPRYFFALFWLAVGLAPVLITGPEASVTRAIGMQPILYLFPVLPVTEILKKGRSGQLALVAFAMLLVLTAGLTFRDYFYAWAKSADVRVQYETTLVAEMDWLNDSGEGGAVGISSIAPNRFHDPSTALMTLRNENVVLRWFDARGALIFPNDPAARMVIYELAPLDQALRPLTTDAFLLEHVVLEPDDVNSYFDVYRWDAVAAASALPVDSTGANFDDRVVLVGHLLNTPKVRPGEQAELVSLWKILAPQADLAIFVHLLGPDGVPLAQHDGLDAPSYYWQPGDYLAQLHRFTIPAETLAGEYPLSVGLYVRSENYPRLPVVGVDEATVDHIVVGTLQVLESAGD